MATLDVFGMCNPLYDLQATVTDQLLLDFELEKGGMFLVDQERQRQILPAIYENLVSSASGGSGANTMTGIAQLGGTACYSGRVGDDEHADLYENGLKSCGVLSGLGRGPGTTGICLVLVTPDAQRTMCTFLGCSLELSPADIDLGLLRSSKYLYVTAYLWDTNSQKEAVQFAMRTAQQSGVKVSLSLSDPFCVHRHKEELLGLINRHVDVIIGNRSEAEGLTDTDSPEEACRVLAEHADIAVVTMDKSGSLICQGSNVFHVPAFQTIPVDTTGAGDMYAAGFLYGLTHGHDLPSAGRLASNLASRVVAQFGPRLTAIEPELLLRI